MKILRALAVLAMMPCALPVAAQHDKYHLEDQELQCGETPQTLRFNLGANPRGFVAELAPWACGNISIENVEPDRRVFTFRLNVPEVFLSESEQKSDSVFELKRANIAVIYMADGAMLTMFWTGRELPSGGPTYDNVLVIQRHCAKAGCLKRCGASAVTS